MQPPSLLSFHSIVTSHCQRQSATLAAQTLPSPSACAQQWLSRAGQQLRHLHSMHGYSSSTHHGSSQLQQRFAAGMPPHTHRLSHHIQGQQRLPAWHQGKRCFSAPAGSSTAGPRPGSSLERIRGVTEGPGKATGSLRRSMQSAKAAMYRALPGQASLHAMLLACCHIDRHHNIK